MAGLGCQSADTPRFGWIGSSDPRIWGSQSGWQGRIPSQTRFQRHFLSRTEKSDIQTPECGISSRKWHIPWVWRSSGGTLEHFSRPQDASGDAVSRILDPVWSVATSLRLVQLNGTSHFVDSLLISSYDPWYQGFNF